MSMINRLLSFTALILLLISYSINAAELPKSLPILKNNLLFSIDRIDVVEGEKMGLLGGSYLFPIGAGFKTGLGVYGAVEGDRGGFFTGGLQLTWEKSLFSDYFFSVQAFGGGGGGGAAPQGGGLMYRTSTELGKKINNSRIAAGFSYINFPNGEIESSQFTLSFSKDIDNLHLSGYSPSSKFNQWREVLERQFTAVPQTFSLQFLSYYPDTQNRGRSGKVLDERMDVIGIRWSKKLNESYWFEFETGGAFSGGIDGFAEVLSGVSYRSPVIPWLAANSGFLVGAAGGGDVDTGGGAIVRVYTGFDLIMGERWQINNQFGFNRAVDGDFTTPYTSFNLAYSFSSFYPMNSDISVYDGSEIYWRQLRIRSGVQTYFSMPQESRKSVNVSPVNVDLTSLKLDAFVNRWLFLTGHALGAATGGAGGYAVGLVGPGFQFSRYASWEFLVGAAGGGGLDVGAGKILQTMFNVELPINSALGVEASIGHIEAVGGGLSGPVSNLSINYYFMQPYQ